MVVRVIDIGVCQYMMARSHKYQSHPMNIGITRSHDHSGAWRDIDILKVYDGEVKLAIDELILQV